MKQDLVSPTCMMEDEEQTRRVRTIFVSDIHLGTRNCQADLLLNFLRQYDADTIYLIGDIFDGWRLRNGWDWPQSHNATACLPVA